MTASNVVALPGYTAPSNEPVTRVVEILEDALALAKSGQLIGVAIVEVTKDPMQFATTFHAEHSSRHSLGSGCLVLAHKVAAEIGS